MRERLEEAWNFPHCLSKIRQQSFTAWFLSDAQSSLIDIWREGKQNENARAILRLVASAVLRKCSSGMRRFSQWRDLTTGTTTVVLKPGSENALVVNISHFPPSVMVWVGRYATGKTRFCGESSENRRGVLPRTNSSQHLSRYCATSHFRDIGPRTFVPQIRQISILWILL